MSHTPGPWNVVKHSQWYAVGLPEGRHICRTYQQSTTAQELANAHIIAAAPDLLAACRAVVSAGEWPAPQLILQMYQMAKDAIAKAEGKP